MTNINLSVALKLAAAGIPVFPARVFWNEAKQKLEKQPHINGWQENASTDAQQIRTWWTQFPLAVAGIELGRIDLIVVDTDRHKNAPDGVKALKQLQDGRTFKPPPPMTRTAGNGFHVFFQQPSGEPFGNERGALPAGVDVRGAGGWVVGPGATCQWGDWSGVDSKPSLITAFQNKTIPALPQWLAEVIRPAASPTGTAKEKPAWSEAEENRIRAALKFIPASADRQLWLHIGMALHWTGWGQARNIWDQWSSGYPEKFDADDQQKTWENFGNPRRGKPITLGTLFDLAIKNGWQEERKEKHGEADEEIKRLAKLSTIAYERERKTAAEKLGIDRVTALDDAVKAQRKKENKEQVNFLPHWDVESWPESVDGDVLLRELQAHLKRYIVLPAHADTALALWVLHTWVFDCFDITPYLCISSPTRRCGKTVLMTMLYWLCCRAKKNDSMSKAAIYRSVERDKPTLVLDEVGWVVDQKDERQNILCGGFERNGHAETCEGEGADITTRLWSTYCPKAFGLIGKLTATLMDRSIEIKMKRKMGENVERLRRRDNDEHSRLRQRCLRWAQDNRQALSTLAPALPDKLNDRAIDFWEPLLAVAAQAGGEWMKFATDAALALSNEESTDSEERGVELLRDIKKIFDAGVKEISTKALIAALCTDEERRWATFNNDKRITDRQLAKLLKPFFIISETVHERVAGVRDDKGAKGYKEEKFRDAFERYLSPSKDGPEASPPGNSTLDASQRPNADGSRTSDDFSMRPKTVWDGREKHEFSYSPSDCDAGTDKISQIPTETPSARVKAAHGNGQATLDAVTGGPLGRMAANGFAISHSPEDRRPGPTCRVYIKEVRHPAIKSGPDDSLDDFVAL